MYQIYVFTCETTCETTSNIVQERTRLYSLECLHVPLVSAHMLTNTISEGTLFFVTFKTFENRDKKEEHYYFIKIIDHNQLIFYYKNT